MLLSTSSQLRTLQKPDTFYIPPWQRIMWLCVLHNQLTPSTRGCTSQERDYILFIYVFKEIRSYFYSRVQGNYVIFIYNCSKKLGPIYIHVFKEIRSYAYALVQLLWTLFILVDLINKEIQIIKTESTYISVSRVSSVHHPLFYV